MAAHTVMAAGPAMAPHVIPALVARHAGDAAFYWQQHDRAAYSPLVGLSQLQEFDRLLNAHLDGLRVAGDAGWNAALAELGRWGGANEAFVAATLGLASAQESSRVEHVAQLVQKNPERMLRGLVGGLIWAPPDIAEHWCMQWMHPDAPAVLTEAAWRATAVMSRRVTGHSQSPQQRASLPLALASSQPAVRAAACRAAACLDVAALQAMLRDSVRGVRAEAAIGWLRQSTLAERQKKDTHQNHLQVVAVLWQACQSLMDELAGLTGWYRAQALRRLTRWVFQLAMAVPLQHPAITPLLERLPARLGLWFVLRHSDPHYLPWVVQCMDNPEVARLAGWVWSAMMGVPLQAQGLALPPQELSANERPTDLQDPGLPEPNVARIRQWKGSLPKHVPCLDGKPLDEENLMNLLWRAPQVLRGIAAQRLSELGHPLLDVRAHALSQQALLEQWSKASLPIQDE